MAEHDDDEPKPTLDPDRAAILERRKRFIALALTGLSTACTSGAGPGPSPTPTKPQPCLKGEFRQNDDDGDEGVAPHPCLSVPIQPDPPPDPPPQVCLKIAQPPADTDSETGLAEEPAPRPCLSKPAPCLKKPAPQPCLKMAEPE